MANRPFVLLLDTRTPYQHPSFNAGEWSKFERRIRKYAEVCTHGNNGVLYLLSGTAFVSVDDPVEIDENGKVKGVRKKNYLETRPGENIDDEIYVPTHCGLPDVVLILLFLIMLRKVLQ